MTTPEAAQVLGLSERHTWRMLAAYREEGAAALAHGNRGRRPANAISQETWQRVITLACAQYSGINHTHLTELLGEREGLVLTRSTVRGILARVGVPSPRHQRSLQHRCRRERMPQEGMLLQLDGSPHAWLGDRGPWLTLLLAVDDATGTVPYALFQEQEDTRGYFLLLQGVIQRRGIHLGVYTDRHAAFQLRTPNTEEGPGFAVSGSTQLGRALKELGVTNIFAHSPQAKGRVERANGTFQYRLVGELRLAGATTLAEANQFLAQFLPRFNERFEVLAAQLGSAYRLPDPELDIGGILCNKAWRKVARDNTVRFHEHTLQLFPGVERSSYAGVRVEIQERLDGRLLVGYRGKVLTPGAAPPLAAELRERADARPAESVFPDPEPPVAKELQGALAEEPIWYEDPAKKQVHLELVRAGMERARQQGKPLGRPRVTHREGFSPRWQGALGRLQSGDLSRRQAAKELGIGYATLKRLLDSITPAEPHRQAKENGTASNMPDVPSLPALPIYHSSTQGTKHGIIDLTDKIP